MEIAPHSCPTEGLHKGQNTSTKVRHAHRKQVWCKHFPWLIKTSNQVITGFVNSDLCHKINPESQDEFVFHHQFYVNFSWRIWYQRDFLLCHVSCQCGQLCDYLSCCSFPFTLGNTNELCISLSSQKVLVFSKHITWMFFNSAAADRCCFFDAMPNFCPSWHRTSVWSKQDVGLLHRTDLKLWLELKSGWRYFKCLKTLEFHVVWTLTSYLFLDFGFSSPYSVSLFYVKMTLTWDVWTMLDFG